MTARPGPVPGLSCARVGPGWADSVPVLRRGGKVVVAHGNSLRAVCALIDDLDDLDEREVRDLNVPSGHPLVYDIASDGRAAPRGGRYLDPTSDQRAAEQIAGERRNLSGPTVE